MHLMPDPGLERNQAASSTGNYPSRQFMDQRSFLNPWKSKNVIGIILIKAIRGLLFVREQDKGKGTLEVQEKFILVTAQVILYSMVHTRP